MKLWKFSGTYLTVTGIIHTIVALIMAKDIFAEMLGDGLINSTEGDYSAVFHFGF